MKKIICALLVCVLMLSMLCGCEVVPDASVSDSNATMAIADRLQKNQPTPTDIEYSLERYNLIRRAYWVNGEREKANALPCPVEKPMGYIILLAGNTILGKYTVDGKVSSLNSFLTPDSQYYEENCVDCSTRNEWLADVDGSYGENDDGIFFFTVDGYYMEHTGDYLYTDMPISIDDPVVHVGGANE